MEDSRPEETPRPGNRGRFRAFLATLRLVYLTLLPLAGCAAVRFSGGDIGRGWGLGIAIGLFLYHYLNWALHETEREAPRVPAGGKSAADWVWLLSPLLVLFSVGGSPVAWLVEQTVLETGAFVTAVAILAMRKCASEGREAPWLLAIIVFVLPAAALLLKLGGFWIGRQKGGFGWPDLLFAAAFVLSLASFHTRLRPFVAGDDQLVEPLSSGRRLVFAVVWFCLLLVGGILLGG